MNDLITKKFNLFEIAQQYNPLSFVNKAGSPLSLASKLLEDISSDVRSKFTGIKSLNFNFEPVTGHLKNLDLKFDKCEMQVNEN